MTDEADKIYQAGYDEGLMHGRETKEAGALTDAEIDEIIKSCPLEGYGLLSELPEGMTCGQFVITTRRWARAILAKSGAGEARDAARYRWIKENTGLRWEGWDLPSVWFVGSAAMSEQKLDDAIDAAMTTERPEP